jgi:AcrR family transcriptional regulator
VSSEAVAFGGRALDGRALGKRGALTRRRLLDATARLLEDRGVRDVRVVDIARAVETSPATFYQYFRDVGEAVLALAEEVGEDLAPIGELLGRDWSGARGVADCRDLVDAFLRYWDEHRAVLRTRNLAAQEGDPRFRAVRIESLRPLFDGLAAKVTEGQRAGRVDAAITPLAAASALVSMMERMAAFHADLEPLGVRRADLVETTARVIHQVVTGQVVTGQVVTGQVVTGQVVTGQVVTGQVVTGQVVSAPVVSTPVVTGR